MSTEEELLAAAPGAYRLFRPEAEIRFDKKRTYASAAWVVPNAHITAAMTTIGGTAETIGVPGFASVTRLVPLRYPEYPSLIAEAAVARACGHNGEKNGAGFYSHWKISVDFGSPDYDVDGPDAWLTVTTSPSGRSLPVPFGAIVASGGSAPAGARTVFVPGYTYSVTVHKLSFFDNAFYQGQLKRTNNALWRGCPAGTVLFNGPRMTRTSMLGGVKTYEVGLEFEVSALPWNYAVFPDGSVGPTTFLGGGDVYVPVDFHALFPLVG